VELSQDVEALEELLEEAAGDITAKEEELRELEKNLKQASRGGGGARGKKSSEAMGHRLRTLYKTLEIDDHAVDTLFALRDEGMKLKAEEALKRLAEEADNVAVRRKVGGLPNHLNIFELGFGGKGRIYYSRGKHQRFRILTVGAKNTQDSDMDYMRRLGREEMS
jgi:putative component of toxin-antitoxin plasmid stabilization module